MRIDEIIEIGIDDLERLYIKPKKEKFTLIYRTATEVHWDNEKHFLYSPIPKDWTYLDWYKHILKVTKNECNCELLLNEHTIFNNINNQLITAIKEL
jgi:hypothetical protein